MPAETTTLYLAFDDTDTKESPIGTGRLMRMFCEKLPEIAAGSGVGITLRGVIRHQMPRLADIPFTSNNSSACAVLDCSPVVQHVEDDLLDALFEAATAHIMEHFVEGSDPGVALAPASAVGADLVAYGISATGERKSQQEAMRAMGSLRLAGLGGTNDGIIGASAAMGLTKHGWCGRFIEYGELRQLTPPLTVGDVARAGIRVLSVDRDPLVPQPGDRLTDGSWLRPSLLGGEPVLQVLRDGNGWRTAHTKRPKGAAAV